MSTEIEPRLNIVNGMYICDACLDGKGGICRTPGCVLIYKTAPDIPIRDDIILAGGTIASLDEFCSGV